MGMANGQLTNTTVVLSSSTVVSSSSNIVPYSSVWEAKETFDPLLFYKAILRANLQSMVFDILLDLTILWAVMINLNSFLWNSVLLTVAHGRVVWPIMELEACVVSVVSFFLVRRRIRKWEKKYLG